MKKRVAIVRGPNLNRWEMQCFTPLSDEFELVGFTSYGHNFPISEIPFEVRKLPSPGQTLRFRLLRSVYARYAGDYHDLRGLERALEGFDLVHSAETGYRCSYQSANAKAELGFKFVVTVWENIPFLNDNPVAEIHKRTVFEAADLLLAVSERAREALLLEGAPAEKIVVQMPGIDLEHFVPARKDPRLLHRFGLSPQDLIVLFVGNLYREKGVFDLLFAFRRLLNRRTRLRVNLLLAGRGRDQSMIEKYIRTLQLAPHARIIGSYPYRAMPSIHNLADIFVLPSLPIPTWQEQFGYVLAESMACGKAVISTFSGSIPEVVGPAGILVPPNDFVTLAEALEALATDAPRRRRLGTAARKRAERMFDAAAVSQAIRRHYHRLLGAGT